MFPTIQRVPEVAALSEATPNPFHDRYDYDVHDPVTPAREQRQQPRPLHRTHIEAVAPGISPPLRVRFAQGQQSEQQLTNDFEDDLVSSTQLISSSKERSPQAERRPNRAGRISSRTHSAILYALEEALRRPYPFTPDLLEENASMSDLLPGDPSTGGNVRGTTNGGGFRAAQAAPTSTGSPGIKSPRDIMRERVARETRRKADQEALERTRAEEEARLLEEQKRRSAERRAAAAGAAQPQRAGGESSGQRVSGNTTGQRISDNSQRSDRRSGERAAAGAEDTTRSEQTLQGRGTGGRAVGGGEPATARPRGPTQSQGVPRPVRADPGAGTGAGVEATGGAVPGQGDSGPSAAAAGNAPSGGAGTAGGPTRSSFPHAFERWETLSAHWEGLTSFWIRRLQENAKEIDRDPLSQQLARQVTDLSAAGANLFHAVVELQRLRASSERKFQRWFFETRQEQERAQEVQAMLEFNLQEERRGRAAAIAEAVEMEKVRNNSDKRLAEMKRELQISKEEARRAWEELGRREQEERDRTMSLRDGRPTLVGGVQVVPMMQGVPSRQGSTRDIPPTREGPFVAQEPAIPEGPIDNSDAAYQEYARNQKADPADPFVETTRSGPASTRPRATDVQSPSTSKPVAYSQAPAVQPASASAFYQQQQGVSLHGVDPAGRAENDPSYGASESGEEEYEIDAQGQYVRDSSGNRVRYQGPASDDDEDEYDVTTERERELAYLNRYGPSASHPAFTSSATTSAPAVDYSGQGYGSGWESVPRHHHPTRLSDVLEEDERSRTSASQVSRRD